MNTRTRMQLLAAFAATTVLFAAGCDQRNAADKSASTSTTTPSTSSSTTTASPAPSTPASTASSTMAPSSSMTASADDATITTKVKEAVMADPNLKSTDINVDTKNGVVTLAGTVGSQ